MTYKEKKERNVIIFESHPVQYKAPVYVELYKTFGDSVEIVYASGITFSTYADREFGKEIQWDSDLKSNYRHTTLFPDADLNRGFKGDFSFRKTFQYFYSRNPRLVILSQLRNSSDFGVLFYCTLTGCPLWLRQETNDEAFKRSKSKEIIRGLFYRSVYSLALGSFYMGIRNRSHLERNFMKNLRFAPYSTPENPVKNKYLREEILTKHKIDLSSKIVGFVGKLIEKKNPLLLIKAFSAAIRSYSEDALLLIIGSGELEAKCKELSDSLGIHCHYAGFVNQRELADYYHAMNILVLPSRQSGETWGLVVNEGLQAGCQIAVSEAVGCSSDFQKLAHFEVFPDDDEEALKGILIHQLGRKVNRDWAQEVMRRYSIQETALAYKKLICKFDSCNSC